MRFKQFLNEGVDRNAWKVGAKMTLDQMIEWVEYNASGFLNQNTPIYRGVLHAEAEGLYNTSTWERRAANTKNFCNLWIDNHPAWSEFPKRSKGMICSTDISKAQDYSLDRARGVYVIIPSDSAKVGICPKGDIWDSFPRIGPATGHYPRSMDIMMRMTSALVDAGGISFNVERDWENFSKALKNCDRDAVEKVAIESSKSMHEILYEFLAFMKEESFMNAFDAFETIFTTDKFVHSTGANMPHTDDREVWVEGSILMLKEDSFKQIRRKLGE